MWRRVWRVSETTAEIAISWNFCAHVRLTMQGVKAAVAVLAARPMPSPHHPCRHPQRAAQGGEGSSRRQEDGKEGKLRASLVLPSRAICCHRRDTLPSAAQLLSTSAGGPSQRCGLPHPAACPPPLAPLGLNYNTALRTNSSVNCAGGAECGQGRRLRWPGRLHLR